MTFKLDGHALQLPGVTTEDAAKQLYPRYGRIQMYRSATVRIRLDRAAPLISGRCDHAGLRLVC